MNRCAYIRKNGVQCTRHGKHEIDGNFVCGTHCNVLKAEEDCVICFYKLNKSKHIKLKCGHFFHTDCLCSCFRRECPLCRSRIDASDASEIFNEKLVQPIIQKIFQKSDAEQARLFEIIGYILGISHKSEWLSKNTAFVCNRLCNCLLDDNSIYYAIRVFDTVLNTIEEAGGVSHFDTNRLSDILQQV